MISGGSRLHQANADASTRAPISLSGSGSRPRFMDRPLVDFIRVGLPDDNAPDYLAKWETEEASEKKWRRKGIAMALYRFGAHWLKEHFGLKLHASGLQQPEAAAAWDKMLAMGMVDMEPNGRRTLRIAESNDTFSTGAAY